MNMSIETAIESLDPESATALTATAQRMGMQALDLLRWKDAGKEKPEPDEFVLGVCSAQLSDHAWLTGAIAIVEYDETADQWLLDGWPEVEDVTVSHWMRLPTLPEGVG